MRKKSVAVVLILGILVLSAGPAYSGWGPKSNKFGPIVILGHPWGDPVSNSEAPPCYRPGSGSGCRDFITAPEFTNFVLQFYFRYIVKHEIEGQRSTRKHGRSE
ncbi:MAG: hypothetical protein KAW02_04010 [candidate division Zixibacteria bacterium]|nr:hypothetical protein [candidate division Zixibacteria bacterium]